VTGEPQDVRRFYEERGWRRTANGAYLDTQLFVDTRAVMRDYRARAHARLAALFTGRGRFFLDAASGANPAAQFSENYGYHVCVDFTQQALREAREQLGARGLYVRADLAHLPLRAAGLDAVYSAHTLYHIPPPAQLAALRELARVRAPGAPLVIVYVQAGLNRAGHWLRTVSRRGMAGRPGQWVLGRGALLHELRAAGVDARVLGFQLLHHALTRALVPDNRLGAALLGALERLEALAPVPLGYVSYIILLVTREA
jgi:SAM-dependent methyltransferase